MRALEWCSKVQSSHGLARGLESRHEIERLRAKLSAGEGVLVYAAGPHRTHLFLFDGLGELALELASRPQLRKLSADQRLWLRRSPRTASPERESRLAEAMRALAAGLLPSEAVDRVRSWRRLTVVGADLVGRPAFAALPFAGATLGEYFELAHLPAVSLLAHRDVAPSEWKWDLNLVGDPKLDDEVAASFQGLGPLPLAPDMRSELTRGVEPRRLLLSTGADANLAGPWRDAVSESALLHFVAHGVQVREDELSRGLGSLPPRRLRMVYSTPAQLRPWEHGAS